MACLGVLFAISDEQAKKILSFKTDEDLVEYIKEDIEEEWDEDWLCETDKAWDAIHRCFANGKLDLFGGQPPLNSVIFGGKILNKSTKYYVSFKNAELVKEIAKAIQKISEKELSKYYESIGPDYQGDKSKDDFLYTIDWFKGIPEFYKKASESDRCVIFTVDQ